MIEINLLPKNYLKGTRTISLGKVGVYFIAAAAGIVLMLGAITAWQMYQLSELEENIDKANQRAAVLQKDIRLVDALIDIKQKIHDRMIAVERLDRHRSVWVRLLQDVAGNVPEFVWLAVYREEQITPPPEETPNSKDAQKPAEGNTPDQTPTLASLREVEIEGYAFTLNALASFMINMMRSDYFDEVELVFSEETEFNNDKIKAYNFTVSCDVHYLSDEELRNLIAQATTDRSQSPETSHKELN
jgi:Tfp pilus assembly protein PilN